MSKKYKYLVSLIIYISIISIGYYNGASTVICKTAALFITTIFALIARVFPMGQVAIFSLTLGILTNTFKVDEALLAFSSQTAWQIVGIFFIAKGFVGTGLSERIALHTIRLFGKTSLGIGYAFVFSNFIMAPLIPSCVARVGGILLPTLKSVSEKLGSSPKDHTENKIGSFLTLLCMHSNAVASATFLTAMAGNAIAQTIALSLGVKISWLNWFVAAIVPSFVCTMILPLIVYYLHPPEMKDLSHTRSIINGELKTLGDIKKNEKQMIIILTSLLFGWIFGDKIGLNSFVVTYVALCAMFLLELLDFERDVLLEKDAWHTLLWISVLIFLSQSIKESGFLLCLLNYIEPLFVGLHWVIVLLILHVIYGYTHYFFASNSSHLSAMFAMFLAIAIKSGTPPMLAALSFCFLSSLFAALTNYSAAETVLFFNSGYLTLHQILYYGIILCTIIFTMWTAVGFAWWKILGLY